MKSFVLTPAAIQDLQSIQFFIANDNPTAARRVLKTLRAAIRSLAKQPGTGHMRQDLAGSRHRFLLVYSYFIVYLAGSNPLQVIRVLHSARDVRALLSPRSEES